MTLIGTPSQTAGPFVAIGMLWNADGRLVTPDTEGSFTISGTLLDGAGELVTDAALEFFQADRDGLFFTSPGSPEGWTGFTRALSGLAGGYEITTVKPGRVILDGDAAVEAPHISVSIFARGLLQRLVTYLFFDDEPEANAVDPLLAAIDEPLRKRLIASSTPGGYRFDIVLQGEEETPFFVP